MADKENEELFGRVEDALDSVRPHLAVDGGNVEIAEITLEKVLKIRWTGMCQGCAMSSMTLKAGIAEVVLNKVPEIKDVVAIN